MAGLFKMWTGLPTVEDFRGTGGTDVLVDSGTGLAWYLSAAGVVECLNPAPVYPPTPIASEIVSTATGDVIATNVQAAIAELASEKATVAAVALKADAVNFTNVDNTSDVNKPVSTAQAAAIALRYGKNNILGAVSQSAGVPTGAIIESGSNANGVYVRFASGLQICTLTPIALALTSGAPLATAIAYPATFVGTPFWGPSGANMSTSYSFLLSLCINGVGLTGGTLVAHANFTQTYTIGGVVIGRWF